MRSTYFAFLYPICSSTRSRNGAYRPNFQGGKWFFSINGQVYPSISLKAPLGEVWRITNASASATYDLNLYDPASGQEMLMQVLSIDGVSVAASAGSAQADVAAAKLREVPCPKSTKASNNSALCVTRLHMMPSSRAEVWVTYRDSSGKPVRQPPMHRPSSVRRDSIQARAATIGRPSTLLR
jgi:L-ascorbate oxidase